MSQLYRYPVKSMLGESVPALDVDARGAAGDRALALVDAETGRVATAKHPRLWRTLLRCAAAGDPGRVRITLPDGAGELAAERDGEAGRVLSGWLGRPVYLAAERPDGAQVERPAPEDVLEHGVDADVDYATLEIGAGTPGRSFVDHSPLHLITTTTLEHIGAEAVRYRPNLVVRGGDRPFGENDWIGRELAVGEVVVRVELPTPRCAVPTLEHGALPRMPAAVRVPMTQNRVEVPGFGVLPCAGVYLQVVRPGVILPGDEVVVR